MSQAGLGFKIVAVGNNVYINGSNAFWQKFGGNAAAQLLSDAGVKARATGRALVDRRAHGRVHAARRSRSSSHGKLAKGSTSTVNGQKVIAVKDTTNGALAVRRHERQAVSDRGDQERLGRRSDHVRSLQPDWSSLSPPATHLCPQLFSSRAAGLPATLDHPGPATRGARCCGAPRNRAR